MLHFVSCVIRFLEVIKIGTMFSLKLGLKIGKKAKEKICDHEGGQESIHSLFQVSKSKTKCGLCTYYHHK